MLSARASAPLLASALMACGGPGLDAQADESLDGLGEREQEAAQVLVALEQASREEDTATLCSAVYAYPGPYEQCRKAFGQLLGRQRSMALEVNEVAIQGDSAVVRANVTTIANDGDRRTDGYTYRLVVRDGAWRVDFQA